MRLPVIFFGSSHKSYHITVLAVACVVLYKVIQIERKLERL